MDDARWEQGMPVLHRQAMGEERMPDRIPETQPTPLQRHYINLSAIALVAGAVAITAIETGVPISSAIVKLCAIVGAPLFIVTTADAALRFYRSAMAWMPLDRGRGLFRLTWVAAALLGIGVVAGFASVILAA
ncbi:MAG TPA: hypothetical protein VL749_13270 [Patescibacteria group bacterium]|jgi:hypothetical protein|nr:hypothetical protein [Patescibacteria group bacterium]